MNALGSWLFTLILFAGLFAAILYLDMGNEQTFEGQARAVDGDSLLMQGQRLRLVGMDAPELPQTCGGKEGRWKCGQEARTALAHFANQNLVCVTAGLDRYDRHLVRCTSNGIDIGARLVETGMAVSYGAYGAEEARARAAKRGLWKGQFQRPQDWRAENAERDEELGNGLRIWFDRLRQCGHTVLNQIGSGEG